MAILREREKIKRPTIQKRRLHHKKQIALPITQTSQSLQCSNRSEVHGHMTTDTSINRWPKFDQLVQVTHANSGSNAFKYKMS